MKRMGWPGRLGKASARRVPVDKVTWMLGQYRTHHMGWNVKHFHEHMQRQYGFEWGYTYTPPGLWHGRRDVGHIGANDRAGRASA
jgi:hypothetical protein